jgi:AAA+ superfamily predicted ATPase
MDDELDDIIASNLADLEQDLAWLTLALNVRFNLYFGREGPPATAIPLYDLSPPELGDSSSTYAIFVRESAQSFTDRVALILAMVPHLRPQLLDVFFTKNATFDRRFTEFGGVRTDDGFEPTVETLAFLLGGTSLEARIRAARVLDPEHPLVARAVLRAPAGSHEQRVMKAPLQMTPEWLALLTTGKRLRPTLGVDFPAQRIETSLSWDDLILHPGTQRAIEEIQTFIEHGDTLMRAWGMAARLRPGYRALFHGPPGTGKTMSAALLGRLTGRDVYRIDLSLVVSKYIGETEKNLARVFDRAQQQGWILFFDEADALFGKRSETKDSHDRYANQEVAYLLQRIESFDGIAILASNLRDNLDDAFSRRFESIVYFPVPRPAERLRLWQRGFSSKARLAKGVRLEVIAREFELSGGSIMNVIRQVSLEAIAGGERQIEHDDIVKAVRRELAKEGKVL